MAKRKLGTELRVGDTLIYGDKRRTIVTLTPYVGTLSSLWDGKAQIAEFEQTRLGQTIEPQLYYEIA